MAHAIRTEVHGHRGCRGHFPANTLPAFLHAARIGCQWIELDVVITGDNQVLVSHEPWMDHLACLGPEGLALSAAEGRAANIHRMPLAEARRYKVKGPGNSTAHKPALAEVVAALKQVAEAEGIPSPGFNIEVKSDPALYGTYQPQPEELARRVLHEIAVLGIKGHCLVQCFDPAVLNAMHHQEPAVPLAFLVEHDLGLDASLAALRFTPAYYSPALRLVDEDLVHALRRKGIGLLVWTVNEPADMRRMLQLGIDGLITDEPAEALALLAVVQ